MRFAPLADEALDDDQIRMAAIAQRGGPYQAFLRAPLLWQQLQPLRRYLAQGSVLGAMEREAAILTLARHWGSTAAFDGHRALAIAAGIDPAAIDAIGRGEAGAPLDDPAALAAEIADDLLGRHVLSDRLFGRARDLWGERGIVELVALVGFFTTIALTLNVAGLSGEAPFAGAVDRYSPDDKIEQHRI